MAQSSGCDAIHAGFALPGQLKSWELVRGYCSTPLLTYRPTVENRPPRQAHLL